MKLAPALLLLAPLVGFAQPQPVKPPVVQYWVSAETAAGVQVPGVGAMPVTIAPQAQSGRRLTLQLGSQRAAAGEPRAAHEIPAGMNMGPALPLVGPRHERAARAPTEKDEVIPERPKGRMLLYWGCGEDVRAGQPVILDFARMTQGEAAAAMGTRRVAVGMPPGPGRSRSYGEWPNAEDARAVPDSASLRGAHRVTGNYTPEIRFALEQDFLERVALSAAGNRLRWNAIAGATGYFAMLTGGREEDEWVLWTSSEVREFGLGVMDYLPPAETGRLVREKVVLAPQVTDCAVPEEVVRRAGAPIVQFVAYGPEVNFAHPPRPADPKVTWEPEWAVKVRFKSTAALLLGAEPAAREERARPREANREQPREASQARKPATAPDPLQEGVRVLRGIFGR